MESVEVRKISEATIMEDAHKNNDNIETIDQEGNQVKIPMDATLENSENPSSTTKEMPTITEFAKAKLSQGISAINKKARQGTHYAKLQASLVSSKSDMNQVAKKIGFFMIDQILNETNEPLPEELKRKVVDIQLKIDKINEELKKNV